MRFAHLFSAFIFVSSMLPVASQAQTSRPPSEATTTATYRGRVSGPSGPLPGAVVKLPNSTHQTVTNADGYFQLSAPASLEPLPAIASYIGFADENITLLPGNQETAILMTTPRPVQVGKRYQLKAYQKTANKQVKRSLRELR